MTPREIIVGVMPTLGAADTVIERLREAGFRIVSETEWQAIATEAERLANNYGKLDSIVRDVRTMIGDTKP